jgi:hypothetical protein
VEGSGGLEREAGRAIQDGGERRPEGGEKRRGRGRGQGRGDKLVLVLHEGLFTRCSEGLFREGVVRV